MKYIVTKTDIFLKGKVHSEGSTIDSKNFSEEDIESVAHLLVPLEKTSTVAVTLDPEESGSDILVIRITSCKVSQDWIDDTFFIKCAH